MLLRLYSSTHLLKQDVSFHSGINIVLGKYSSDRSQGKGVNGIGKSTLIRLIAYSLLSESTEKLFEQPKYNFLRDENHSISLDFKIHSSHYTIERSFKNRDEIHFGERGSIQSKYTREDLRAVLLNKMFPTTDKDIYLEGNRFGSLMHFFIKDDLDNHHRRDPLNFLPFTPSKTDISIYTYFLLGLPTRKLIHYKEISEEYRGLSKTLATLEDKAQQDTGKKIAELKSEKIKLEDRISVLEESLRRYEFLPAYQEIEKQLLELTQSINEKLAGYHSYNQKLKKVRQSYQNSVEIDTFQIQQFYNEMTAALGDAVKKTLDEVQQFKKNLLENRNKFLLKKEQELQLNVDSTLAEIAKLEERRSELYKLLQEKGALESITNTYQQLVEERSNLGKMLQFVQHIDSIRESLTNLDVKLSQSRKELSEELLTHDAVIDELRSLFQEILNKALLIDTKTKPAYFEVQPLASPRRNQLPFDIKVEIPKDDALGQSRLKIVAYDLMVFLHSIKAGRDFPKFLIHDGVFHGIARETVVNTLNYIYHRALRDPSFQYLTTFNEDELPNQEEGLVGKFEFDFESSVVVKLEDVEDLMIFKRAFD